MPLKVRVYDCPQCGMHKDRDLNASDNLVKWYNTTMPVGINAWGDGEVHARLAVAGAPSMNQEMLTQVESTWGKRIGR